MAPFHFISDSDSEHCATFHPQKIDTAAHEQQQKYAQNFERTAKYLGSILEDEELEEEFLKRSTWAVRR